MESYKEFNNGANREVTNMKPVENFGTEPFQVDGCGFATVLTSVSAVSVIQ